MSSTHRLTRGSVRRSLALAAAGAMVFALTPVQSAFATHGAEDARDTHEAGDVCDGRDDNEFDDIADERTDAAAECLADLGIAYGFVDGDYHPTNFINRQQMASFLARKLMAADGYDVPANPAEADYTDREKIAQDHLNNVDIVTEVGIAKGYDDGRFGPGDPVTRGQMAAFIVRQIEEITGETLVAQEDHFTDDNGHWSEENINILADLGIVEGDTAGNYNANDSVTRGQMALFIARDIDALNNEYGVTFTSVAPEEPAQSNQTFTVNPQEDAAIQNNNVRQFAVSGITSATADILLLSCGDVTTDENGVVTFAGTNPGGTGNVAQEDTLASNITVINGAVVNEGSHANDVTVSNGSISFSVQGAAADDCFVAVVFDDADDDDNLDLGANGQPTEAFGVSGDTVVTQAEATEGAIAADQNIEDVNLDLNVFETATAAYFYDANDEFQVRAASSPFACTTVTMEQFEAVLSTDDELDGAFYRTAESGQSVFCIDDRAPFAPTNVVVDETPDGANAGKAGLEVEFDDSTTETVDEYRVFRATATQPAITGQTVTCPTIASGSYSQVGTVDDTKTTGTYTFFDSTAQPAPSATPENPSYCYFVRSVDETGDEGPASTIAGPAQAATGDTSAEPEFASASAPIGSTVITVTYDEAIKCASVDADASNYAVTTTNGGVTTAETETAASCVTGPTTDTQVEITITSPVQSGDTVTVTAKNGADGNTVLDTTDVAQPVGDAVQTSSTDQTAPNATASSADQTTIVFQVNEDVNCASYNQGSDVTESGDTETIASSACDAATDRITVTMSDALESGETVTLLQDSIQDASGNAGPPADVVYTAP